MQHHRYPAHHDIPHLIPVEGLEDRFEEGHAEP
jgi:hypothetical protein